jgi:transcriptional regulator with XRE-family HTH domain
MKNKNSDKKMSLNLAVLEKKLKAMAQDGDLNSILEDIKPAPLSDKKHHGFYTTVKRASIENHIIEARKELPRTKLPFGRHIQWIRAKGGISKRDIAQSLRKDISYIDKIEEGRTNPLCLLINDLAEIMQLFKIKVSEFIQAVKAYQKLTNSNTGKMNAMARSSFGLGSDKKEEALSHAFDAVRLEIVKKKKLSQEPSEIDKEFIEKLKIELKRQGYIELLK